MITTQNPPNPKLTPHSYLSVYKILIRLDFFCIISGFVAFIFLLLVLFAENKTQPHFELFLATIFSVTFYFSVKKYRTIIQNKKLETVQKTQSEKLSIDFVLENKIAISPLSKRQRYGLNVIKALLALIGFSSGILCFSIVILEL
ncbi:MAG: hypothetical protein EBS06_01250 [Proteobacteria bacterium]|nr:hypothetical protein [Pseudomonadota bacterium]